MFLAVDAGNTNITFGVYEGKELKGIFRMTTKLPRTSDEYGFSIRAMVENHGVDPRDIHSVIITSVVPNVMHSLVNSFVKYFNIQPKVVDVHTKKHVTIATENPGQIGPDRIVDVEGAFQLYGGPLIVIDFGTATTYDLVLADGSFTAGVTAPGIRISAEALWVQAARLPEIEIRKPASILAKETISSMQAGLIYGQIGQTEYIVRKMKEESGLDNIRTVATGGLGTIIAGETDVIDIYNPNLTLEGMRFIHEIEHQGCGA